MAFKSDKLSGKFRYIQLEVTSAVNVQNGNSVASWENGLLEAQVYARNTNGETSSLPISSLASGTYASSQNVVLSSDDDNAAIHYTTDGSNPNADSAIFDAANPILVTKGTTTLKAMAIANGKEPSGVISWTYTVIDPDDVTALQEGQATEFAVTADEGASGLPTRLKAVTADGNRKESAVTWNTDGLDFNRPYTETSITGSMAGGFVVHATVAVTPKNLVFFVDSGTKPAEGSTSDSAYFSAAKTKYGDQLLNRESDQKFD